LHRRGADAACPVRIRRGVSSSEASAKKCVTLLVLLSFVFRGLRRKLLCTVCHLISRGLNPHREIPRPGRHVIPMAEAMITCIVFRGPEGPRFHRNRESPRLRIQLSKNDKALVERAGTHGASDRSPRLDWPSTLGALSLGRKTAPTDANSFSDRCLLWEIRMPVGNRVHGS
jgi:hypothetical protein